MSLPLFQNPYQGQNHLYQKDCVHVSLSVMRGRQVGVEYIGKNLPTARQLHTLDNPTTSLGTC